MLNKRIIFFFFLIILILSPALSAQEFETPKSFVEYIYQNYAAENFNEVYINFAAELKRVLTKKDYIKFQKENFEKYDLEYTEIQVSEAKKINFENIKEKYEYAADFGEYYQIKVSYLLKFSHFGHREKKSDKLVHLRKIENDFQIFWDHKTAMNTNQSEVRDDQNE